MWGDARGPAVACGRGDAGALRRLGCTGRRDRGGNVQRHHGELRRSTHAAASPTDRHANRKKMATSELFMVIIWWRSERSLLAMW